ncbi:MAG: PAS domain-containing protein [Draconibacterium sp.]
MKKFLSLDENKLKQILDIKLKVFRKELSPAEAKELVNETFDKITPEEFAYGEQQMLEHGITDELMVDGMDDIIDIFQDVLVKNDLDLAPGHPIQTYANEAAEIEKVVATMEQKLKAKFIKNEWLELYEKLSQINIHFSRKQNQLFSALERKGFDRPSTVMWTFDNRVRDAVKEAFVLLKEDKDAQFIEAQPNIIFLVRDILEKEREILYPTSLKLLTDEEFAKMRISDDEIGYCLIDTPPPFTIAQKKAPENNPEPEKPSGLLSDLAAVLQKHGITQKAGESEVFDVAMGKLTLQQINLIFKHLQVDLSYVDEKDVVKFYSDTQHRVFPRSAGVIGRKVQNCHPRESVSTVEAIIEAFRNGTQDKAEFWLEMGDKFIYIVYNAVRDEEGNFRGVLEMMQDVTHIRSLQGSRKLLTWDSQVKEKNVPEKPEPKTDDPGITKDSVIAPLLKKYPFLRDYLVELNPRYKQLKNPVVFNTMGNIATLEMIAARGDFEVDELVRKIISEVEKNKQ